MEYTNINDDVVEIYLLTVKYIHNLLKKKLQNSIWSVNPSLIDRDTYRYGQEKALAGAHKTV